MRPYNPPPLGHWYWEPAGASTQAILVSSFRLKRLDAGLARTSGPLSWILDISSSWILQATVFVSQEYSLTAEYLVRPLFQANLTSTDRSNLHHCKTAAISLIQKIEVTLGDNFCSTFGCSSTYPCEGYIGRHRTSCCCNLCEKKTLLESQESHHSSSLLEQVSLHSPFSLTVRTKNSP